MLVIFYELQKSSHHPIFFYYPTIVGKLYLQLPMCFDLISQNLYPFLFYPFHLMFVIEKILA